MTKLNEEFNNLKAPLENKTLDEIIKIVEKKEKLISDWKRGLVSRNKFLKSGLKENVKLEFYKTKEIDDPELENYKINLTKINVLKKAKAEDFFD